MNMLLFRVRNLLALCILAGLTGCCCMQGPCGPHSTAHMGDVFTPTSYSGCVDCDSTFAPCPPPLACNSGCGPCYGPPAPPCLHVPPFLAWPIWHKPCQLVHCLVGSVVKGVHCLFSCPSYSGGCNSGCCGHSNGCEPQYMQYDNCGCDNFGAVEYGAVNQQGCQSCNAGSTIRPSAPPVGSYYPPIETEPFAEPSQLRAPSAAPLPPYPHSRDAAPTESGEYFTPPDTASDSSKMMIIPPSPPSEPIGLQGPSLQGPVIQQATWVPTQL